MWQDGWTPWSAPGGRIRTREKKKSKQMASITSDVVEAVSKDDIEYDDPPLLLGRGGFGSVHKGTLRGTEVAVKRLFSWQYYFDHGIGMDHRKHHIEAIKTEINIMSSISHPGLVKILGVCLKVPDIFFVMEFCRGGTLEDAMEHDFERLDLPLMQATKSSIVKQVAAALEYLHSSDIAYRDLKSANILLVEPLTAASAAECK